MKYTLSIEGDYYEDYDELKVFAHLHVMQRAFHDALSILRSEIKHGEHDEKGEAALERVREALWINGME